MHCYTRLSVNSKQWSLEYDAHQSTVMQTISTQNSRYSNNRCKKRPVLSRYSGEGKASPEHGTSYAYIAAGTVRASTEDVFFFKFSVANGIISTSRQILNFKNNHPSEGHSNREISFYLKIVRVMNEVIHYCVCTVALFQSKKY